MKLPKKTKEELKADMMPISMADQDRWPYGLQIRFEKEQIDKMPSLKGLKVGDTVNIEALGTVTAVRMSERQKGEPSHSVEIQIEKVDVQGKKPLEKMNMKEYLAERNKK
jgi:hypothetical protein